MSQLPEIDYHKVAQRLSAENASLSLSKATLEILAEALRAERDSVVAENQDLKYQLSQKTDGGQS
jgi:hypothetical protein